MSKRTRLAKNKAAEDTVEVISLLDDSSASEDDPDEAAADLQQMQQPAAQPSKRLRRMDAAAAKLPAPAPAPTSSQPSASQCRQASADGPPPPAPSQRPTKLRQATLPMLAASRPTNLRPLQMLNITRARIGAGGGPTASTDSQQYPHPLGSPSPAPSPAPSSSQRSRLSQDPEFVPSHQQQQQQQQQQRGGSQNSPTQQQRTRPQVRQLMLAPARSGAGQASSAGGGGGGSGDGSTRTGAAAGDAGQLDAIPGARVKSARAASKPVVVETVDLQDSDDEGDGDCDDDGDDDYRPTDRGGDGGSAAARAARRPPPVPAPVAARAPGRSAADTTAAARPAGPTVDLGSGRASGMGGGNSFTGAGAGASGGSSAPSCAATEMWSERHAPRSEEDLLQVLHRNKVAEVRGWLEHQMYLLTAAGAGAAGAGPSASQQASQMAGPSQARWAGSGGPGGPRWPQGLQQQQQQAWQRPFRPQPRPCGVAVLSGPAGCGKSASLRVLAETVGFEVVEWTPPPPVLWSEYQYQRSTDGEYGGVRQSSYQSKLDDFEAFVNRSKYPSLTLTPLSSSSAAAPAAGAGVSSSQLGGSQRTGPAPGSQPLPGPGSGPCRSRPKLLLLEDLPHTSDLERRQRLGGALRELAACARGPVVLVATEAEGQAGGGGRGGGGGGEGGGSTGGAKGLHKDLLAALQSLGAHTISFNPITANNITKLLLRVAEAEALTLSPAEAVGLAEAADGDLRSALQALQMTSMLRKAELRGSGGGAAAAAGRGAAGKGKGAGGGRKKGSGSKGGGGGVPSATAVLRAGRQQALTPGEVARLAAAQRDLGLPLFHALGKFLHNKRGEGGRHGGGAGEGDSDGGGGRGGAGAGGGRKAAKDSVALQQLTAHSLQSGRQWVLRHHRQLPARFQRPPMRYDPEAIILRCGLEAPPLLAFLHENYLPGFVDPGGPDPSGDVAVVAEYLSDSAVLCGQSRAASALAATCSGGTSLWLEDSPAAANLASSIAASVAARGLMYGNTHPASHRFNPIRAPASTAIDSAAAANRLHLRTAACRLAELPPSLSLGLGGSTTAAAVTGGPSASLLSNGIGSCITATGSAPAPTINVVFAGSAAQLVGAVLPWLRALVQISPGHAAWLAPALPAAWSYFWNGAVTEGAFLHRIAQPPPASRPPPQHQPYPHHQPGGQGPRGQPGGGRGGVEGILQGLVLEDDDPIEG